MRPVTLFPALLLSAASLAVAGDSGTVWATPHDSYSSSVGVLGCKINTNRVAYWPGTIDCSNICVQLSYGDRSVKLLRIDQSGGAYDVSYDAWNYLYSGYSATDRPITGGAIAMEYKNLDASECASLIKTSGHKLPLSASNSMNFLTSCLDQANSWVAKNYVLYNILDAICTWGYDEKCTLDYPAANQANCSNTLGAPVALTEDTDTVYNIQYGTGKQVPAGSAPEVADYTTTSTAGQDASTGNTGTASTGTTGKKSSARRLMLPNVNALAILVALSSLIIHPLLHGL